jgi:hypothetical protein
VNIAKIFSAWTTTRASKASKALRLSKNTGFIIASFLLMINASSLISFTVLFISHLLYDPIYKPSVEIRSTPVTFVLFYDLLDEICRHVGLFFFLHDSF